MHYENPVIRGYFPDPSILRVGEDFYLVNSTFEWYPGVPVYHSKNLVNWELITYCLTTPTQLKLDRCPPSGGIFAPTLRYHDGLFYMTVTNVTYGGNLIVHAREITGPWSDPVYVDQDGIDPSLLFDDDGTVYYTTAIFDKDREGIYICEVDPLTGEKKTETRLLTRGCGGRYAEGPHLYKIQGKYYLMLAEGGTEYGHTETMMRAGSPYGPFEPCPHNPILTNRDVMNEEIKCTGHADLVEDQNGNWWLVHLGVRPKSTEENRTLLHNLGRETFLVPVTWDEAGWPHVGKDGTVSLSMDAPLPGPAPTAPDFSFTADFSVVSPRWGWLRNPHMEHYQFAPGRLTLTGTEVTLSQQDSPTFVGVRQPEYITETEASVRVLAGQAGLSAYYSDCHHYDLCVRKDGDHLCLSLRKHLFDLEAITAEAELPGDTAELKIVTDHEWYTFLYRAPGGAWQTLGRGMTAGLCTEITHIMTFTGVFLGMFAENGKAEFSRFTMNAPAPKL